MSTRPFDPHDASTDNTQHAESRQSATVVPNEDSLLKQNLKQERESRERESKFCENAVNDLEARLKAMQKHLEMEQNNHDKTRSDLIEKQKDEKNQRRLALEAVGELNRFLRGKQAPNQLTDDEIIQKAMTLRIGIRDFAILHFGDSINEVGINLSSLEPLNEFLRMEPDYLKDHVSTYCRAVNEDEDGDYQRKRKFHTWRANTTNLLDEAMSLGEVTADPECQQLIRQLSNQICQLLEPIRLSRHQDYQQGLEDIISQSVELDKEIYKQIANINWFGPRVPCTFASDTMELEPGQAQNKDHGVVNLLLGPGLVKQGKSSGDRFDMTERLLKAQVFCGTMENIALAEARERRERTPGAKGTWRRWLVGVSWL
ncbi:hypothetical protein F4803DRAFT_553180 [Xylaria telfairii]|nr:hypothetical protein F4803DRAFT_553180 [Xylaria telfairii]